MSLDGPIVDRSLAPLSMINTPEPLGLCTAISLERRNSFPRHCFSRYWVFQRELGSVEAHGVFVRWSLLGEILLQIHGSANYLALIQATLCLGFTVQAVGRIAHDWVSDWQVDNEKKLHETVGQKI